MTKFSFSRASDRCGWSKSRPFDRTYFELDALFRRLERFEARRRGGRSGAVTSSARRTDAELLEQGKAFEAAWASEVTTLIELKRRRTPDAEAVAESARAAAAHIAARIQTARATTLDGLKVKARAILWRRNGEPLQTFSCGDYIGEGAAAADLLAS